jgi:hypothetical protein
MITDDLTHYMKAVSRLKVENERLQTRLTELETWAQQVTDALDGRDLSPYPDEAPARIASLKEALREIARGDWVAPDDLAGIARDALAGVPVAEERPFPTSTSKPVRRKR